MKIKQSQYAIWIQERSPPSLQSLGDIANIDSSLTMTLKIFILPWGFDWRSRRDRNCISILTTFQFSFYFIICYHFISSATSLPLCNSLTQFYLSTLDLLKNMYPNVTFCTMTQATVPRSLHTLPYSMFKGVITKKGVVTKKKYKPVVLKVRPVITELPKQFHIHCNIIGNPLEAMPTPNPNPLPFMPTGRYTYIWMTWWSGQESWWFLMGPRAITHAWFYVPTESGIHMEQYREGAIQTQLLSSSWYPCHSTCSLHWAQYSYSTWYLWWSMCNHQEEAWLRCLWTIKLILSITLVLCLKEGWNVFANCLQSRAIESHHYQTFRSTSNSQTPCREIHRSFMQCNVRFICWIWWMINCRIIMRLYHFPDALWGIVTCYPTNGLDEFSTNLSWWHYIHPIAWNSSPYYLLHQQCPS